MCSALKLCHLVDFSIRYHNKVFLSSSHDIQIEFCALSLFWLQMVREALLITTDSDERTVWFTFQRCRQ